MKYITKNYIEIKLIECAGVEVLTMADYRCQYGYGWCEVPYKDCPHWQGTFCELDVEVREDG